MPARIFTASFLFLAACGQTHGIVDDTGPAPDAGGATDAVPLAEPDAPLVADAPSDTPPDAPVASRRALASCLSEGGGLVEVATVDNNDHADHGGLLRFGLSGSGLIAAAGADGTVKLWSLSAELLDTFEGRIITYGPEIPSAPATDIAFDGDSILVGDVRGIVLRMVRGEGFWPEGGTTPEIPIRAVAFDAATGRLAHAQFGDVLPLTVRDETGVRELESMLSIHDLMFDADGALLVAGERDGRATIERRASSALESPADVLVSALVGPFVEIARARGGLLGVTTEGLHLAGASLERAGGRSIAVAENEDGSFALVAGTFGLEVRDLEGGRAPLSVDLPDAVTVRVDATGTLAVVGTADALIHVLGCRD